jgi:hypothetical protein
VGELQVGIVRIGGAGSGKQDERGVEPPFPRERQRLSGGSLLRRGRRGMEQQ